MRLTELETAMFERSLKRIRRITAAARLFGYNRLLDEIDAELDRIELSKERIRKALNRKGYAIPKGIRMDDWVGIIDERIPQEDE